MGFFFSDQTAQDKEKQRNIKYILHKCILEHSALAESDSGDKIGQWSLNLRANDLTKDRFWLGSSIGCDTVHLWDARIYYSGIQSFWVAGHCLNKIW